jgi:hypothetical protein
VFSEAWQTDLFRPSLVQCFSSSIQYISAKKKKSKTIPVTGRDGPQRCERSRLSHFLDNRLTDGGEVVSLTRRPLFTSRKISGTHFC